MVQLTAHKSCFGTVVYILRVLLQAFLVQKNFPVNLFCLHRLLSPSSWLTCPGAFHWGSLVLLSPSAQGQEESAGGEDLTQWYLQECRGGGGGGTHP